MQGREVYEINNSRIPGMINVVPYRKAVRNYIIRDVPVKPHKTRRQSQAPFSIYTFEDPGTKQRDGEEDQLKYLFVRSNFLYTCYLHIF